MILAIVAGFVLSFINLRGGKAGQAPPEEVVIVSPEDWRISYSSGRGVSFFYNAGDFLEIERPMEFGRLYVEMKAALVLERRVREVRFQVWSDASFLDEDCLSGISEVWLNIGIDDFYNDVRGRGERVSVEFYHPKREGWRYLGTETRTSFHFVFPLASSWMEVRVPLPWGFSPDRFTLQLMDRGNPGCLTEFRISPIVAVLE